MLVCTRRTSEAAIRLSYSITISWSSTLLNTTVGQESDVILYLFFKADLIDFAVLCQVKIAMAPHHPQTKNEEDPPVRGDANLCP